jgi:hypothetical protein
MNFDMACAVMPTERATGLQASQLADRLHDPVGQILHSCWAHLQPRSVLDLHIMRSSIAAAHLLSLLSTISSTVHHDYSQV